MASKLRIFTTRFLLSVNIVVVIVFLLACLVPHLNPRQWWFISFLGLAFPFLLFIVLIFFGAWLIVLKPRLAVFSAIALLLGFKGISVFFALHNSRTFNYEKNPKTLRVATWNVARFIELKENNNQGSQV